MNHWRAERGGWYYWVDERGEVDCDVDQHTSVDTAQWETGNYYEFESDAEAAAERVKAAYWGDE